MPVCRLLLYLLLRLPRLTILALHTTSCVLMRLCLIRYSWILGIHSGIGTQLHPCIVYCFVSRRWLTIRIGGSFRFRLKPVSVSLQCAYYNNTDKRMAELEREGHCTVSCRGESYWSETSNLRLALLWPSSFTDFIEEYAVQITR